MNEEQKGGDNISANISGGVSGQAAVGKQISQEQTITSVPQPEVTEDDLAILRRILANVKVQVESEAPAEKKEAALQRVVELEEAVTAKQPDLDTMAYVKKWFIKNLPSLSGAVTGVVIHPIVGKLVGAAGDALADEFRDRFSVD